MVQLSCLGNQLNGMSNDQWEINSYLFRDYCKMCFLFATLLEKSFVQSEPACKATYCVSVAHCEAVPQSIACHCITSLFVSLFSLTLCLWTCFCPSARNIFLFFCLSSAFQRTCVKTIGCESCTGWNFGIGLFKESEELEHRHLPKSFFLAYQPLPSC